jgi:hypothetical protein
MRRCQRAKSRLEDWLITSLFIALGWVALLVLPQLLRGAGALVLALILTGGIMYSLGAVVDARKRPDPSPRWFGFHEVFHAATILAYLTQYAAVSLVVAAGAGRPRPETKQIGRDLARYISPRPPQSVTRARGSRAPTGAATASIAAPA